MRNINRTYPGVKDGTMTEQISYAITNMINTLDIDMEMDLHEASPEYPTVYTSGSGHWSMGFEAREPNTNSLVPLFVSMWKKCGEPSWGSLWVKVF